MAKPRYSDRKTHSAASVLSSTLKAYRLDKELNRYAAFPHWPQLVSEKIAEVSFPEKIISGNLLVVRVKDAVWAQELELKKPELIKDINDLEDGALIEDIRFTVGNPKDFR